MALGFNFSAKLSHEQLEQIVKDAIVKDHPHLAELNPVMEFSTIWENGQRRLVLNIDMLTDDQLVAKQEELAKAPVKAPGGKGVKRKSKKAADDVAAEFND